MSFVCNYCNTLGDKGIVVSPEIEGSMCIQCLKEHIQQSQNDIKQEIDRIRFLKYIKNLISHS